MKITYLGTGAAEGVPALFCQCDYCKGVRERGGREIRSRAQVLIDGDLSIDFPPDAFYHSAQFGVDLTAVEHLLVTHSHMDHFYAHDFILRGYKYGANLTAPSLAIYGNREVGEVFAECTRRELRDDVASSLSVHTVSAFTPFSCGAYTVTPLPATHSSNDPFLYLVEKNGKRVLHLTDTGRLSEAVYSYLAKEKPVHLVTLDCTFLWSEAEQVRRHMGLADNAATLKRLEDLGVVNGETKRVITHFSHNSHPSEESLARAEKEYGVIAAYDGMSIEI